MAAEEGRRRLRFRGGSQQALLRNTPERDHSGKSAAPVTVYLYEDFQCPFCGQFSRQTFPELVNRDVRDGKVRIVSEILVFLGPDSVEAAKAALAAAEQNRYWPYYSLLFENQGRRTAAT